MSVLSGLPGIMAAAMGQTLFRAATLHAKTPRVSDGRGGFVGGTISKLKCRALVTEFTDHQRMMGNVVIDGAADEQAGIAASDRNIIILAATLNGKPKAGDSIVIDGEAWNIASVKADPANATYECKSARVPMPSGDTTEATAATLLDTLPGIMNDALGPALFSPAMLYVATGRTMETRHGTIATYSEVACSALVVDYTDFQRGIDNIPTKDRKALILSRSIANGLQPKTADILVINGAAWGFVTLSRDPAGATFEAQATPARAPTVGRTGSLSVRTADATMVATGSPRIVASMAVSLADAVMTGRGSPIIVGALSLTTDNAMGAGGAESRNRAALAVTTDDATLSATGEVVAGAIVGVVTEAATMVATGSPVIQGALAVTTEDATLSSTQVPVIPTGTLEVTTDDATLAGSGSPVVRASLAGVTDDAIGASEGYQDNWGALAATTDDATLAAAGTPTVQGALALTTEEAIAVSNGSIFNAGQVAATLEDAVVVAEGYQDNWGALAITAADATMAATATPIVQAALAITTEDAIAAAEGSPIIAGALSVTTGDATMVAEGEQDAGGPAGLGAPNWRYTYGADGDTTTYPAVNAGDVLIAFACSNWDVARTITPPSGWTLITSVNNTGSSGHQIHAFIRQCSGSETGSITFTGADWLSITRASQVDPTTPIAGYTVTREDDWGTAGTMRYNNGVNATRPNSMVITCFHGFQERIGEPYPRVARRSATYVNAVTTKTITQTGSTGVVNSPQGSAGPWLSLAILLNGVENATTFTTPEIYGTIGAVGTSVTFANPPDSVAEGDRMIAFLAAFSAGGAVITPPSGWSLVGNMDVGDVRGFIYTKVAGSGEAGPYEFTNSGGGTHRALMFIAANINDDDPFTTPITGKSGTGATVETDGITTEMDWAALLWLTFTENQSPRDYAPNYFGGVDFSRAAGFIKPIPTAGASGGDSAPRSGSAAYSSFAIALNPKIV